MAVLISAADKITRRLPKVLSPKAHAAGDYLCAGIFFAAGVLFWRNHRRAALGSLFCGGVKLATSALTDYDGDQSNIISLPLHEKVDLGLAGMSAAVPEVMNIGEPGPKRFFLGQALLMTALANVSHLHPVRSNGAEWLKPRRRA